MSHERRRTAAVLVILAAAFWWHAWMPAVAVIAFVAWALLHRRYQGARREGFMRFRRRAWPPAPLALIGLIVAGTAVYVATSGSAEAKALPIALNVVAAGMILLGSRRRVATS